MKTYTIEYQETISGRIEVRAKDKKQAREKAFKKLEKGCGDIISTDLEMFNIQSND